MAVENETAQDGQGAGHIAVELDYGLEPTAVRLPLDFGATLVERWALPGRRLSSLRFVAVARTQTANFAARSLVLGDRLARITMPMPLENLPHSRDLFQHEPAEPSIPEASRHVPASKLEQILRRGNHPATGMVKLFRPVALFPLGRQRLQAPAFQEILRAGVVATSQTC